MHCAVLRWSWRVQQEKETDTQAECFWCGAFGLGHFEGVQCARYSYCSAVRRVVHESFDVTHRRAIQLHPDHGGSHESFLASCAQDRPYTVSSRQPGLMRSSAWRPSSWRTIRTPWRSWNGLRHAPVMCCFGVGLDWRLGSTFRRSRSSFSATLRASWRTLWPGFSRGWCRIWCCVLLGRSFKRSWCVVLPATPGHLNSRTFGALSFHLWHPEWLNPELHEFLVPGNNAKFLQEVALEEKARQVEADFANEAWSHEGLHVEFSLVGNSQLNGVVLLRWPLSVALSKKTGSLTSVGDLLAILRHSQTRSLMFSPVLPESRAKPWSSLVKTWNILKRLSSTISPKSS